MSAVTPRSAAASIRLLFNSSCDAHSAVHKAIVAFAVASPHRVSLALFYACLFILCPSKAETHQLEGGAVPRRDGFCSASEAADMSSARQSRSRYSQVCLPRVPTSQAKSLPVAASLAAYLCVGPSVDLGWLLLNCGAQSDLHLEH